MQQKERDTSLHVHEKKRCERVKPQRLCRGLHIAGAV